MRPETDGYDAKAVAIRLLRVYPGWSIFPLTANSKRPPRNLRWRQVSTGDLQLIESWAAKYPGCNWGVDCGKSGLLVLDLDVAANGGASGEGALGLLEVENEDLPLGLTVRTPRGGQHRYFLGEGPTTQGTCSTGLAPKIDTRGVGGYVVAPGCVINGRRYEIDGPVRSVPMLPEWLAQLFLASDHRDDRAAVPVQAEQVDPAAAERQASDYLTKAPAAIEGQGGDRQTYEVACRLRDFGLEEPDALALLLEAYNPRCVPPWEPDDLARKVANAYRYAQSPPGVTAPEAVFSPLETTSTTTEDEDQSIFADDPWTMRKQQERLRTEREQQVCCAAALDPATIPPRRWILGHRLVGGQVTVTVAPGGVGKSVYSTLEAMSVASGRELTGDRVVQQGAVLLLNTEDPVDEIERRIAAAGIFHSLPRSDLGDLHYLSSADRPLRLVVPGQRYGEILVREDLVQWIIDYIDRMRIVVLSCDPFVRTHMVDENDNMAVDAVVQCFGRIARATGAAVSLVHHTRKKGDNGGRGDAETARGASSLISACRIAHTLDVMDEKEADLFRVSDRERRWYLRLDDAKANLSQPTAGCRWFRRESVTLPNGDHVGTLRCVAEGELEVRDDDELETQAAVLSFWDDDPLKVVGTTANALARLVQVQLANGGSRLSQATVRRIVMRLLEKGVFLPDRRILRFDEKNKIAAVDPPKRKED